MKDLINFLKKYGGWQWYGNDKATRNIVNKLVLRGKCKKRKQILDNGYIYRQVKLIYDHGTEVVIEDEDAETNDNQLCFKKSEIWLSENKLKNLEEDIKYE
mgnify:CR=1 FL=1